MLASVNVGEVGPDVHILAVVISLIITMLVNLMNAIY